MSVSVKIVNLKDLISMSEKYPVVAERRIGEAITRVLTRVWGEEKRQAPFGVSGNLRDNWTLNVGRFSGFLRSNAPYAMAVHEGSAPHYVSPNAIRAWAQARGLNEYAVAKSIAKKGTKANPFFKRSVEGVSGNIDTEFMKALDAIVQDIKW